MRYVYNSLEEYVKKMYGSIGIHHPHQLDPEGIAARLGLSIAYGDHNSTHIDGIIFIDERQSKQEAWQDFGHELCHALLHGGNQMEMPLPYRVYQEWKAINFAYQACVPTFMLLNMDLPSQRKKAIWTMQETFGVTYDFALKRLNRHYAQLNHHILFG